jgi:hypothetical protein
VGVLSRVRFKAPQSQMPLRLLQPSMSLLHELQRIRFVILRRPRLMKSLRPTTRLGYTGDDVQERWHRHHR